MKTLPIILLFCFSILLKGASLSEKMEDAWLQLTQSLFCPKTNLIYDSICRESGPDRFEHLPALDEIKLCIPNPLGWATGMEDSMLNAGSAMDVCILRAELEPQKRSESKAFAAKLFKGMVLCATIHGKRGYVVRSVSPRDGKSCYPESSVDQITFWVWGLWRYYHSDLSEAKEKEKIRVLLSDLAEHCEKEVTKTTAMRNPAGKWSRMTILRNTPHHTAMRLPMFYAAAYDVSKDSHWKELYEKAFESGKKRMETVKPQSWNMWTVSQHQASMRLCYDVDTDSVRRDFLRKQMQKVSKSGEQVLIQSALSQLHYSGPWNVPAVSWRDPGNTWKVSVFNKGTTAIDPQYKSVFLRRKSGIKEFLLPFDALRNSGYFTIGMMLSPDYMPSEKVLTRFHQGIQKPEYRHHTSAGLVNILHAYYLVKQYQTRTKKGNSR